MTIKFRSNKDKKGNTYTYPIETEKKTKTKKSYSKPVKKAKKRIKQIKNVLGEDNMPLGLLVKQKYYITPQNAIDEANETIVLMKQAMKKSKKTLTKQKTPQQKNTLLTDDEVYDIYAELNR